MERIVIVDDDEIMLEGVVRNIPWEQHGFEIIGTAWNGLEGYELVAALQPDIVISDIRMAHMSGLEMTEKIKANFPRIQVILLTGYDDFQYAKKALTLKVTEYVLKYADYDQILAAVTKAKVELEQLRQVQNQLEQGKNLMEERFLQDRLLGWEEDRDSDLAATTKWNNDNFYCVALLQLQATLPEDTDFEPELGNVAALCAQLFPQQRLPLPSYINQMMALLFWYPKSTLDAYEDLPGLLEQLQAEMAKRSGYRVKIGVGNLYQGRAAIAGSYREARELLELPDLFRTNPVIFHEQLLSIGEEAHHRLMHQITVFIQENYYQENLSLAAIAEAVHICPSYICTLFKKYQKVNFSDYLINLRIEKAKDLLRKTALKNYEVAEKVGYTNAQYFSVLFKKLTGLTPTEYKKGELAKK